MTLENGIVYYEKIGEGTPILFIHPPGLGRRVFDYQRVLSSKYQIILPDFSGHGWSKSFLNDSIFNQYIKEINAILRVNNLEKVIICGYSAGGMIAQEYALRYPLNTEALILSGGYPKVDTVGLRMMYNIGVRVLKASPDLLAKILAKSHARDQGYREILYEAMKLTNVNHWIRFYEETYQYDCSEKLMQLQMPVLSVYGKNAYWIHKHKIFYKQCKQSKLAFIKNEFHQIPTKKWQAFNHILENFIKSEVKNRKF
ncbi:alpha/beta hydrolase [Aquibacillus koreensis]|uniref:Alpha/beta hydrolase n=1 Tax=Aquibacillus koreensis TaxID=279446 RepID=A0A9X3WKV7_9BACI|nr:alpha/beta hydrolase [Aquibacillus koreensis]MCT2536891.1 alpha/beta hydrolase [Aquibacillus koreensis]MDC3421977.1 alpha/beta hydrolase [Aquibacillus koreensis]